MQIDALTIQLQVLYSIAIYICVKGYMNVVQHHQHLKVSTNYYQRKITYRYAIQISGAASDKMGSVFLPLHLL